MQENNEEIQEQVETQEQPDLQEQSEIQEQEEQQEAAPAPSPEETNFRRIREEREREKEARIRAEYEAERLKEYIQSLQSQNAPKQEKVETSPYNDDDYVEYRDLKEFRSKQDETFKRQQELLQAQENEIARIKLTSEYNDYYDVVTPENLEALERTHPEVAPAILYAKTQYESGKSAYKLIKQFVKKDRDVAYNRHQAKNNLNKPMPSASVNPQTGNSPLSKINSYQKDYTNINFEDDYWVNLKKEQEAAMKRAK